MSDNFIIMSFPRYAGGKFISNCLSLSKYCCPQDPKTAKHLINFPDDYDYRLCAVMSTLPPDRSSMINWIEKYEFGDVQLYQDSVLSWRRGIECEPSVLVNQLLKSGFRLFLTAHGGEHSVGQLLKVWPKSTIIKLINHSKFSKISHSLKSTDKKSLEYHSGNYCESKYNILAGHQWPSWTEFESAGYDILKLSEYQAVSDEILNYYNWRNLGKETVLFDMDNSIFNKDKFLFAIEELYTHLGFLDFNSNLVEKFWQSYMTLHIDNVD